MRSLVGALALLVVLAVVGLVALRQMQGSAPANAASGALPSGPGERARAAQQRAAEDVARAMEAASASRDTAELR